MKGLGPELQPGGPTEVFAHERASATPAARIRPHHPARTTASASAGAPVAIDLPALERWFADVVTSAGDLEAAIAKTFAAGRLEAVVTAGPELSALDRLGVYHHAYAARLVECLLDDYPAIAYAIGDEAFTALCRAYVERHPSRGPNLNSFGRHMAAFCGERGEPLLADLARLEWSIVEVLHAETAEVIAPEALAQIAPERWADARLAPAKAARVHAFAYPVNAFFQAYKDGKDPPIPAPSPSATAIWRRGYTVWRMDLTPAMARLLEALFAGAPLGEALSDVDAPPESIQAWFAEWIRCGLFASVSLPG